MRRLILDKAVLMAVVWLSTGELRCYCQSVLKDYIVVGLIIDNTPS